MKKKSPRRALASLRAHLHSRADNHTGTPAQSRASEHTGTPAHTGASEHTGTSVRNRASVRAAALLLAAVLLAVPTAPSLAKFVASRTVATISLNVAEKPAGNMLVEGEIFNGRIKGHTQYKQDDEAMNILSVTFGKYADYSTYVEGAEFKNVDELDIGAIQAFRVPDGSNYHVYVLLMDDSYNTFIANPTSRNMLSNLRAVTQVNGLDMLDTSNVKDMSMMFNNMRKIETLDLHNFDTSNVRDMQSMFAYDNMLTSLEFPSTFVTSSVTNMKQMFHQCKALTELDISGFDTAIVTDMTQMFNQCDDLKTIYVSPTLWNTNSVTASDNMFNNCKALIGGDGQKIGSSDPVDKTYACIGKANADGTVATRGYLTDIADKPTDTEPVETTTEPTTEATTSPTAEPTSNPTTEATTPATGEATTPDTGESTTPATGESTTPATADPSTPPASETLPPAEG